MIKLFLIALPVFLVIDMIWLGLIAKNFYAQQIGLLMKTDVNWIAAICFYLLFVLGLVVFVIAPAMERGSLLQVLLSGAFFGLVCYATYDLTNLAVAKDWSLMVTVVDLWWGSTVAGLVSAITFYLSQKI